LYENTSLFTHTNKETNNANKQRKQTRCALHSRPDGYRTTTVRGRGSVRVVFVGTVCVCARVRARVVDIDFVILRIETLI
jgi:hypothetical protein